MGPMMFTYPKSLKTIVSDIQTDPQAIASSWGEDMPVFCLHCGETHVLKVREAFFAESHLTNGPFERWTDDRYDRHV